VERWQDADVSQSPWWLALLLIAVCLALMFGCSGRV
jgi:hypothetical protein